MSDLTSVAQRLLAKTRADIPLTAAMQVGVQQWDGTVLTLTAPLAPNVNDKGTAFAGSIAAMANLSGWALLSLWVEAELGACQVAIYRSELAYRRPLQSDFTATAQLPSASVCEQVLQMLRERGKAKINLEISLADAGGEAVTMGGSYAIWLIT